MRRLVFVILVSSLLVTLAFVQKVNIPVVKASSSIYQGDLVLTGNNVTTIEDKRFDINGSIVVEENATLILKNAIINFTKRAGIFLQNPVNGNPRLRAENTKIVNAGSSRFYENSSAIFSNCSTVGGIAIHYYDESEGTIINSTLEYVQVRESSKVSFSNSTLETLGLVTHSSNSSIIKLSPGLIDFWDFWLNCSVAVDLIGKAPNVTLMQTTVNRWDFSFQGYPASHAEIVNSEIWQLHANALSHASVYNSTIYYIELYESAVVELTNSTYSSHRFFNQAKVCVSWYLDLHVIDSISQDVPSANVTVTYPNATVAESKLTDVNGWVRLTLMEKMMNKTGNYPVGNYTVEATYESACCMHASSETTLDMTENKRIILILEDFIIPEFPSFLILPLFMLITLLAVIVYRRKHSM